MKTILMRGFFVKNKLLPLILIILGALLGYYILHSGQQKPAHFNKKQFKRVRTVQTIKLEKGSVVPFWNTSGFVKPAELVKVYARVAGNVEAINPLATPGVLLKKGQWLAKLEEEDFNLSLQSQQAQLEQAQAQLALVKVDQVLAKEELLLLNNNDGLNIDESLVLREPQLTVARAKVFVAKNNLAKAKLNMERSTILTPFDGKIISKDVGLGSKVSNNTSLFSIVNTNVYWIEVKIPHKFLTLFDKSQPADVYQSRLWGEEAKRQAKFISVLPELDNKDRQIKLLLAIDKPLVHQLNQPQVFINDFLNVQLKGKPIDNAWTIKHAWLQADNTIWVVDKNSTLQKRKVKVLFKGRDVIYVRTKIEKGDRALAEKPGIASIGLQVRTRKSLSNAMDKFNQESPLTEGDLNSFKRPNEKKKQKKGKRLKNDN